MLAVSTMGTPPTTGLFAGAFQKVRCASRKRRWIKSSRAPLEKYGSAFSLDLGSKKTLGWLAPLSIAGQPSSVNQIGLLDGTQSVASTLSTPQSRL